MRFEDSVTEFEKRVHARGLTVEGLGISDALDLMVAFYRDEPVTGIAGRFEDALQFSSGVRDRGQGEHYEINLARVVTSRRDGAPPLVRELELTYRFAATSELRGTPRSEYGCSTSAALPLFESLVRDSEAFAIAQRESPLSVSIIFADGAG